MIVGPIGSGKSTLLESILGETLSMGGRAERNVSLVVYCSQTPWLQSENIRRNIIGASVINMDWYATVVSACALDKDLAQLPRGDQTPVGNNGLTLSGGQKQRIVSELRIFYNKLLTSFRLISKLGISSSPVLAMQSRFAGRCLQRHRRICYRISHSQFIR